jgi:hypothetical protein
MNKYWSGLVVAGAMAATVAVGAQSQSPANTPPPDAAAPPGAQRTPAPPSAQARPSSVTVSGCLQNAPMASATGAAGAKAPAESTTASKFVLNNASMGASGSATAGAVGTSGTTARSYNLEGDTATISPHVNHRVEVTGQVQANAALAPGQATAAPGPTLKVESVKVLADTCAPLSTTPGSSGQAPEGRTPQPRPEPQPDPAPRPVVPPQP